MPESTRVTKKCLIGIARRTGVPSLQFEQHGTQQAIILQVREMSSLGDCPDETRYLTALGSPAQPMC